MQDETLFRLYPALASLPASLREAVSATEPQRVPQGAVLFDERDACRAFPMLLEGSIRVSKSSPGGRELVLYRVVPGESCILTSSCLLGGTRYTARGVAESDLVLAALDRALFARLVAEHAPFREYVFELFAERMTELMALVEAVAFRKLDQRLASLLLGKGTELKTTHQQLADELASVREIVTRILHSFADRGWVRLSRERIEIADPAALRRVAAGQG